MKIVCEFNPLTDKGRVVITPTTGLNGETSGRHLDVTSTTEKTVVDFSCVMGRLPIPDRQELQDIFGRKIAIALAEIHITRVGMTRELRETEARGVLQHLTLLLAPRQDDAKKGSQ